MHKGNGNAVLQYIELFSVANSSHDLIDIEGVAQVPESLPQSVLHPTALHIDLSHPIHKAVAQQLFAAAIAAVLLLTPLLLLPLLLLYPLLLLLLLSFGPERCRLFCGWAEPGRCTAPASKVLAQAMQLSHWYQGYAVAKEFLRPELYAFFGPCCCCHWGPSCCCHCY